MSESRSASVDAARGILAMLVAVALFSAMDAIIKDLRADYGAMQILFCRMAFAALPLAWLIHAQGGVAALRTRRLGGHVGRTLLVMAALFCFFHAFGSMALADVYAISYAAPLLITALGAPMLGERVGPARWAAVAVGFLGVLVILRPGGGMISAGGAVALAGTVLYALNAILLRQLSRTDTNAAILFYFTVTGTAVTGALALPFGWVWPSAADWAVLAAVGVIGGVAQIFITQSFRLAPVAVVSPFQYSSMLWGLIYGLGLFGDVPDGTTLLGAAILIATGLAVLHRETRGPAPDRPAA